MRNVRWLGPAVVVCAGLTAALLAAQGSAGDRAATRPSRPASRPATRPADLAPRTRAASRPARANARNGPNADGWSLIAWYMIGCVAAVWVMASAWLDPVSRLLRRDAPTGPRSG